MNRDELVYVQDKFHGVSFASPDDAPEVYRLMIALHDENGIFSLSEEKSMWMCANLFQPGHGIVGVIRGEKEIEGAVALEKAQQDYSTDIYLLERFNHVRPEYRRSDHAKRLIEFAKACATDLGIPLLMGIVSTQRVEAKMRLYRRLLIPIGGSFMWGNLPRLAPDIQAAAGREDEDDDLLADYKKAVEQVLRAEKVHGKGKYLTRDEAMTKLRAVHDRARNNSPANGHDKTHAGGDLAAM